jgi:hypothetical protein
MGGQFGAKWLAGYLGSATKVPKILLEKGQQTDRSAGSLFELQRGNDGDGSAVGNTGYVGYVFEVVNAVFGTVAVDGKIGGIAAIG